MFKLFALMRRNPGAGWYEFRDFLRGDLPNAARATVAGRAVDRIVAFNVLERDFRPTTNAGNHVWSGVLAYDFADESSAMRAAADAAFLAAATGRPDMIDEISYSVVREVPVSEEETFRPGDTKIFAFFKNSLPLGNPMSRVEMFVRWNEHAGRMQGHKLDQLMTKFTQNQVLPHYHSADPRYDYDGISEIWFPSVEKAERLFKNYDAEQKIIPSSAAMGGTAGDCVYLRTDEVEVYLRG